MAAPGYVGKLSGAIAEVESLQAPWAYVKLWSTNGDSGWEHTDLPFFTTIIAVGECGILPPSL